MITQTSIDVEFWKFFEVSPDLVCITKRNGFFEKVNQTVLTKMECSEAEIYSRPIKSFIHPDDIEKTSGLRVKLFEGEHLTNLQNRYISNSGIIYWLEWTSVYLPETDLVLAIAKDITSKKNAELEASANIHHLQQFATHFKYRVEQEKKSLAYELHEQVAQLASAVKMDMEMLGAHSAALSEAGLAHLANATRLSLQMMTTIQRFSFAISPGMLEDFGLTATIEWLSKEFTIINNIPCSFIHAYAEDTLSQDAKLDLFRICQEALSNIINHASASFVTITLLSKEGFTEISIKDNGKGFVEGQSSSGSGMIIMRQLAASMNATFFAESLPGSGTTITIIVKNESNHTG